MSRRLIPLTLLLAACGGPGEALVEDAAEIWSGDAPSIDYDRCNERQERTLDASLRALRASIHPHFGGASYLRCLADAVVSDVWRGGATPEDIYRYSNAPGELEIGCVDLERDRWGQATQCDGGQEIEVDSGIVDDVSRGSIGELDLGGVLLHELLHVQAGGCFAHPDNTGTIDYELTVNREAQRCAASGRPLIALSSIGGKVPLSWVAWSAPEPLPSGFRKVGLQCADDMVVVGLDASAERTGVRRIGLRCARPTASGWDRASLTAVGTIGPTGPSLGALCPDGRAVTGATFRYDRWATGTQLGQVSASCWPVGNLRSGTGFATLSVIGPFGTGGGTEAVRACPAGRALVGVTGVERGTSSGRTIEALQPVCRPIGEVGRRDIATRTVWTTQGGNGGSPAFLRCLGNGVGIGIAGGAGARVDRLGLLCGDTDPSGATLVGTLGVSPSVGGKGGASFSERCAGGQALVGLRGRSGTRVDQVAPVCADFAGWRAGTSATVAGTPHGGGGGGAFETLCARGQFVVGLRTRSGAELDQVQVVCSDALRP